MTSNVVDFKSYLQKLTTHISFTSPVPGGEQSTRSGKEVGGAVPLTRSAGVGESDLLQPPGEGTCPRGCLLVVAHVVTDSGWEVKLKGQ